MNRSYHVCALSDQKKARNIETEISKVDGVQKIKISKDLKEMQIKMENEKTPAVMERVVNICNRISNGCEVRYKFT